MLGEVESKPAKFLSTLRIPQKHFLMARRKQVFEDPPGLKAGILDQDASPFMGMLEQLGHEASGFGPLLLIGGL